MWMVRSLASQVGLINTEETPAVPEQADDHEHDELKPGEDVADLTEALGALQVGSRAAHNTDAAVGTSQEVPENKHAQNLDALEETITTPQHTDTLNANDFKSTELRTILNHYNKSAQDSSKKIKPKDGTKVAMVAALAEAGITTKRQLLALPHVEELLQELKDGTLARNLQREMDAAAAPTSEGFTDNDTLIRTPSGKDETPLCETDRVQESQVTTPEPAAPAVQAVDVVDAIDALTSGLESTLRLGPPEPRPTTKSPYTDKVWDPPLELRAFPQAVLFSQRGPLADDVHQGAIGDCYFCCALTLLAEFAPQLIQQMIHPTKQGTFEVTMHDAKAQKRFAIETSAELFVEPLHPALDKLLERLNQLGQLGALSKEALRREFVAVERSHARYGKGGEESIVGVNKTAKLLEDVRDELRLKKEKAALPLYMALGDNTAAGALWPCLVEKAWAVRISAEMKNAKTKSVSGRRLVEAIDTRLLSSQASGAKSENSSSHGTAAKTAYSLGDGSYEDVESGAPAPMRKVPGAWSALTGVKANECIDFPKAKAALSERGDAVRKLWQHVHHERKPAALSSMDGEKEVTNENGKKEKMGVPPTNGYYCDHSYAVVGSAIRDAEQNALVYVCLGAEEGNVLVDIVDLAALDEETTDNCVKPVGQGSGHGIGGEKYLILRNPHNRNPEFTKVQLNPKHRRNKEWAETSLHRVPSLTELNYRPPPPGRERDMVGTNYVLIRLEDIATQSFHAPNRVDKDMELDDEKLQVKEFRFDNAFLLELPGDGGRGRRGRKSL